MTPDITPSLPAGLNNNPLVRSWVQVESDGAVTVFSGKVEIGQGILTAFAQIVAYELAIDPDRVRMVATDTDRSPDQGYTAASKSIEEGGTCLRLAAATLRKHLTELAATVLETEPNRLETHNGVITGGPGNSTTYSALAPQIDKALRVSTDVSPRAPVVFRNDSADLLRIDLPAKILGRPTYVQDLQFDGMVFGRVVRAPSPAQNLVEDDLDATDQLPGIVATIRTGNMLGVVAEREEQAVHAMRYLERTTRWQGQTPDPVRDPTQLTQQPTVDDVAIRRTGLPAREGTDINLTAEYTRRPIAHASLGPSSAVAIWDNERLTVWTHSQGIFPLRGEIAQALGLPTERVRVLHTEGAGCYGHNGADDAALDAAVLALAVPGRPVKLQWTREQEFLWEPYGPAMLIRVQAGVGPAGHLSAWKQDVWSPSHMARPGHPAGLRLLAAHDLVHEFPMAIPADTPLPGSGILRNAVPLYEIANLEVVRRLVPRSTHRTSSLRGLGAHVNVFAIESMMDELAANLKVDPLEFRLRNLTDVRARTVLEAVVENAGGLATGDGVSGRGLGFAKYKNLGCYVAVIAEVEAETEIRPRRVWAAVDAGRVVNRDGVRNQIEGGIIQSLSWALLENAVFDRGNPLGPNWNEYQILGFKDVPTVEVVVIDRPGQPSVGVGEGAQGPATAALANGLAAAIGARVRHLPMTKERVTAVLLEG